MAIVTLFISIRDNGKDRIWKCIILFFNITEIDSIMENITGRIMAGRKISEEKEALMWELMSLGCILLLYIIDNIVEKITSGKRIRSKKIMQGSVILADVSLCICASFMFNNTSGNKLYFYIGLECFVGVVLLGNQILNIFDFNSELKETIEQRQIMTEMQKQYYEGKLRDEEIIRKYRHDMINHFMVIKYYLNRDKIMCNIFKLAEKCS